MTIQENAVNESVKLPKVAVIDDAFDDYIEGEIEFESFLSFHQIKSETGEFSTMLGKHNIAEPADIYGWSQEAEEFHDFLRTLWELKDEEGMEAFLHHEYLFADKLTKLNSLNTLCKNIANEKLEVKKIKSDGGDLSIFASGEFVYVFIDYNLDVKVGSHAVEKAKKMARKIYDACPPPLKPLTVLMSSEDVNDEKKEEFQKDAGLLEGIFRFSPKSHLANERNAALIIGSYMSDLEYNVKLQEYIEALESASKLAQSQFQVDIKKLRIEDYEFIQNRVLDKQEQALGEYLAWLYGSHWGNLLWSNSSLLDKQFELDSLISTRLPLHHNSPSPMLSDLLMTALFERDLKELTYPKGTLPHLHLGDIFTKKGSKTIFMVINPQCDLERTETDNKENYSILLIPGNLNPISKQGENATTDLFIFEDAYYSIKWKTREVKSIPLNKFSAWQSEHGAERQFRLRQAFALDVQRQFSADISRVGLPVSPPFITKKETKIFYRRSKSEIIELIPSANDLAFFTVTRESQTTKLFVTSLFIIQLRNVLLQEVEYLRTKTTELKESGQNVPPVWSEKEIALSLLDSKLNNWFFSNQGFSKAKDGIFTPLIVEQKSKLLSVIFNREEVMNGDANEPLVWISITDSQTTDKTDLEDQKISVVDRIDNPESDVNDGDKCNSGKC